MTDETKKTYAEEHPIADAVSDVVAKVAGIAVEASSILSGEGGDGPALAREVAEVEVDEFVERVLGDEPSSEDE